MIVAQLVAGLISGIAVPAIYANATAIAPPGREAKTVSIVLTGWMISMVVGVSISALLASLVSWRAVYVATALLALGALLFLSRMNPVQSRASMPTAIPLTALSLPEIKSILISGLAFLTAFYGVYGYLGDHLRHGLDLPLGLNGLVALTYGLGFGSAVFFDHTVERLGRRWALPVVLLLIAAIYFALALASNWLIAMLLILGALGLLNHLGMNQVIVQLTAIDQDKRGAIMGLNAAATNLAAFLGASGFGPIYERFGFAAAACAAGFLSIMGVLAVARRWSGFQS